MKKEFEFILPKWLLVMLWLILLPIKLISGGKFIRKFNFSDKEGG